MRKILLFVVILAAALSLLTAVSVWYLSFYGTGSSSWNGMGQMWGSMMGYNNGGPSSGAIRYLWILVLPLVALVILGVAGLGYYIVYPEIGRSAPSSSARPSRADTTDSASVPLRSPSSPTPVSPVSDTVSTRNETPTDASSSNPSWPVLVKTSKPDERKVLEVLAAHNGAYLQKFIVKESGLSKLQTHRIIARLEERGIVRVVESGNTNEVSLAQWLGHPEVRKSEPPSFAY